MIHDSLLSKVLKALANSFKTLIGYSGASTISMMDDEHERELRYLEHLKREHECDEEFQCLLESVSTETIFEVSRRFRESVDELDNTLNHSKA